MFSASRATLAFLLSAASLPAATLKVCADPNNLPYSNRESAGFENELARLVAHDLGRTLELVWVPQRGRYLRSIKSGACDVIMGVPTGMDPLATTDPYYRAAYVFVTRRDAHHPVRSFADPWLRGKKIGIHLLQEEDATSPPVPALVANGLFENIVWYKLFPNFTRPNPPSALIEAVRNREVDTAIAWGPMAGYFTNRSGGALQLVPVPEQQAGPPLAFNISMAVRRGNDVLRSELNRIIRARRPEFERILRAYGVPVVSDAPRIAVRR